MSSNDGNHTPVNLDGIVTEKALQPIVDDDFYLFFLSISFGMVSQTVCVFGVIANIINVVVFMKQGFGDSVNISLFALAISDLSSLITLLWSNLCFTPAFQNSGIPMVTYEVQLITGSWPHVIFTRTTGWITAYISFERCICVLLPLKIRSIITRKRTVIAIAVIYFIPLSCASLAYFSTGIRWQFYPDRNQTLLGIYLKMDAERRELVDSISYVLNGVIMPVSCFLSVVLCTVILVVKLNQKAAWRNSNSSATNQSSQNSAPAASSGKQANGGESKTPKAVPTKDQKAAKMVVFISSLFITCFIPAVATFIAATIQPELSYDGVYKNLFLMILSISFITEAINSSINIFIYVTMSSKYRETFMVMFRLKEKKK